MSHRFRFARVVLTFVACSFVGGSAVAQTGQNFGELVGKVVDDQGGVLPADVCILAWLAYRRRYRDGLFFGLTAGALLIVRRRDPAPGGEIAPVPGHPVTTILFVAVAAGVVLNSFIAYPTQSLIGSSILVAATIVFFIVRRAEPRTLPR